MNEIQPLHQVKCFSVQKNYTEKQKFKKLIHLSTKLLGRRYRSQIKKGTLKTTKSIANSLIRVANILRFPVGMVSFGTLLYLYMVTEVDPSLTSQYIAGILGSTVSFIASVTFIAGDFSEYEYDESDYAKGIGQVNENLHAIKSKAEDAETKELSEALTQYIFAMNEGVNFITNSPVIMNSSHGAMVGGYNKVLTSERINRRNDEISHLQKLSLESTKASKAKEAERKLEDTKEKARRENAINRYIQEEKEGIVGGLTTNIQNYRENHQNIIDQLDAYESDILEILKFPLMNDLNFEPNAKFKVSLHRANMLKPTEDVVTSIIAAEYMKAVDQAFLLWNTLKQEAQRIKQSSFSEKQRKRIILAQNLLQVVMDSSASKDERKVAYEQAMKNLDGVIVVEESKAIKELRNKTQMKEITS